MLYFHSFHLNPDRNEKPILQHRRDMTSNESTVHTQDIFLDWEKKTVVNHKGKE